MKDVISLHKIELGLIDKIVKVLREELEYVEGNHEDGTYYSQWVMAVAIKEVSKTSYLARIVIKTSGSPYVDGTDITINIMEDGQAELDLSFAEKEPIFHGGEGADSIRWIENINNFSYMQPEDPFNNEAHMIENEESQDQILINSNQEELYLRMLRYALDEYSFRNLGEFNCFDGHIRNIINLYKALLLDTLLVQDIVVDGVEVSPGKYKLQITIDDTKYILTPINSFTKDHIFQEIKTKIIQSIVEAMKK